MRLASQVFMVASGIVVLAQASFAGIVSARHIEIVAGMYGKPGSAKTIDITEKLQDLCGAGAESCSVFCSDTSFGRYKLGRKPICRVTYRCGADYVHSVEAWREEPILMRCPEQRGSRRDEAVAPTSSLTN